MGLRRNLTHLLFLVAAAVLAFPAYAGDAEPLIRKGLDLRKEGRDREALALFQQAVEQERTPRALAQFGLCEQAMGLWASAELHLAEALKSPGDVWIKKNGKVLEDSLAYVKGKLGSLEIWGTPDGATVTVDDAAVGKLPLAAPLRVGEGRRTINVEAPGYVADTRTVDVRAGGAVREHIALARAPGGQGTTAANGPPGLPGGGASTDGAPQVAPLITPPPPPPPQPSDSTSESQFYRRWWFWTVVGAVAVAGGVTTYLVLRDSNDGCVAQMGAPCW